jgi:hypothetical protein
MTAVVHQVVGSVAIRVAQGVRLVQTQVVNPEE